jgi:hypothetical protein
VFRIVLDVSGLAPARISPQSLIDNGQINGDLADGLGPTEGNVRRGLSESFLFALGVIVRCARRVIVFLGITPSRVCRVIGACVPGI